MFERIVIRNKHDARKSFPGTPHDLGFLAEAMLFYGHVHLHVSPEALRHLVSAFGPELLMEYLTCGYMTLTYSPDQFGVANQDDRFGFVGFSGRKHELQHFAPALFMEQIGKPGKGRRLAKRFIELIREERLGGSPSFQGLREELGEGAYVVPSIRVALEHLATGYTPPEPLIFSIIPTAKTITATSGDGVDRVISADAFNVETTIDFAAADKFYRINVPPEQKPLSPADLLTYFMDVRFDLHAAAELDAELGTTELNGCIIENKIGSVLRQKESVKNIACFQTVTLEALPSLREVMNSGSRTFADLLDLLKRAQKFRDWVQGKEPSADLAEAYFQELAKDSWIAKAPAKSIRFAFFTAAGIGVGFGLGPIGGAVAAVALNAADYFLVDRLAKGWKPNQFVDGPFRRFVAPK